jgi:hypothetical protein
MRFATYQAFRTSLQWLIEGDELTNTFSINVLDLIVGLGEARVYRDLRASSMQAPLSLAVTSNAASLPADLLELSEVYFSGKTPLQIIPLDRMRALEANTTVPAGGGATQVCAEDGDTLRFWPPAADTDTVLGSYYAKPGALSEATTADLWALQTTFARYPEVFTYACLVEAMPFLGMESKVAGWEARYEKALTDAMGDERMRVYAGGPLRMRTR